MDSHEYEVKLDGAGSIVVAREKQELVRVSYESQWGSRSLGLTPVSLWPLRLDLKPHPPRGWRVQVKRALVRLKEPVNMLKDSQVTVELELPVDIGVYVNSTLAGVLPVGRVKYAIYGTPDLGDPCRFVNPGILEELPPRLRGRILVSISSKFEENSIQISRIVVPTLGLGSYLSPGEKPVFSGVSLEVYSRSTGMVRARGDLAPPDTPLEEVLPLQPESFYIMRFGF